jgi:hypothetical protein
MDRKISILAATLIVAIVAGPLFCQQKSGETAAEKPVEISGRLRFPPGTRLDFSKDVSISVRGIQGTFAPDGAKTPPNPVKPSRKEDLNSQPATPLAPSQEKGRQGPPSPPMASSPGLSYLWTALAILAAVALGAGSFWYYSRRYLPRKEMEPYWNAVRAIRARNYESALPGLTSMESKLPPDLRRNARFFIALCHVHLENEVEAEQMLAALHREAPGDANAAYLLAYLRIRRGLDAEAEPVLEAMSKHGHQGFRDTRRLTGIVKFRRGMEAMRAGDIDLAATRFAAVEKLGDFAAFIPGDLRNRHISLGTRALFEHDAAQAREHFEALKKVTKGMAEEEARPLLVKSSLGLALAMWIEGERNEPALEKALAEACLLLHPEGPLELPWPGPEAGSGKGSTEALKRALEAADKNVDMPASQRDERRCLRDLHLLRALAVLKAWAAMDGEAANKEIPTRLEETMSRLACARAADERFADVYLVAGLLNFYLHKPGPERTTAVDILAEARKLGARESAILDILENRDRIERENADAVDKYQQTLDRYLRDETVLQEVRRDLLQRLSTLRSLMNRYKPPDLTRAREVEPTVNEMKNRWEVLHRHIEEIQKAKPNDALRTRTDDLRKHGEALAAQAAALQSTEADLLVMTAEQLFPD